MSDAPIVSVEGGVAFYRASALGSCPRAFWFARHGFDPKPPPPAMQAIFDEGHTIETLAVDILAGKGIEVLRAQEEVLLYLTSEFAIRGHIDGIVMIQGNPWLIEIKGFGHDLLDQFRASGFSNMPGYHLQISAYAHALGLTNYVVAIYDKETESDDRVAVFANPTPLLSVDQLRAHVLELELSAHDPVERPSCTLQYPCPYFYLHEDERPLLTPSQRLLATGYLALNRQIKLLEDRRQSIRDRLLAALPATATDDRFTVSVIENAERMDQRKVRALMAEAGIPVSDFMTKPEGHYIRVTDRRKRTED